MCEFWRKNLKNKNFKIKKLHSCKIHIKITNSESVSIDVVEDRSSCISNIETLVGISRFLVGISRFALFELVIISTSSVVVVEEF